MVINLLWTLAYISTDVYEDARDRGNGGGIITTIIIIIVFYILYQVIFKHLSNDAFDKVLNWGGYIYLAFMIFGLISFLKGCG